MLRVRTAAGSLALALGASACMVFSGVDELEVRKESAPEPTDKSSPTDPVGSFDASLPKLDEAADGGAKIDAGGKVARSGALVCGAQGTWSACQAMTMYATCTDYCRANGKTCVDNCCATDSQGDYPAKIGMYYAFGALCALDAAPASASAGYCNDPVLPFGYDVRCCCR